MGYLEQLCLQVAPREREEQELANIDFRTNFAFIQLYDIQKNS
jgi:hypothetical protein